MNHQMPYNQHHMGQGAMDPTHNHQMYDTCKNLHLYFIQIQTTDGNVFDGIIEDVDQEGVTLLMPDGEMDENQGNYERFGYGGFGGYGDYGGYGYPPYGYGRRFPRRFRRFRRHRFPFFGIRTLFFPFFF